MEGARRSKPGQPARLLGASVAAAFAVACYTAPDRAESGVVVCQPESPAPAAAGLRRLADYELARVLEGLVGEPVALDLPRDPLVDGFDNHAEALVVSPPKLDGYLALSARVAPKIAERFPCSPEEPPAACSHRVAGMLARKLYGRSLGPEETQRLIALGDVERIAKAMLLSPHTLYRTELGPEEGAGTTFSLAPHEIASALSFLFTGERPTTALLEAAERGELQEGAGRIAHARVLLESAGSRAQLRRLVRGWLGVSDFDEIRKFRSVFPEFTSSLQRAMSRELDRFVDAALFEGEGTLAQLLGAARAFPDAELSAIYGAELLGPPSEVDGTAVDPARRRGVLLLPAVLTKHATPDGTNPVDRGLLVRSRIFCDDFGSPPVAAQMLTIDRGDSKRTTREKFEVHDREPACASCHASIDPVGFALESFDGVGRSRREENGRAIDTNGELTGTDVPGPFAGPTDVVEKMLSSDQVRRCFAIQVKRFADGRRDEELCAQGDATALAQGLANGRAVDVLLRVVARPSFVLRRRVE